MKPSIVVVISIIASSALTVWLGASIPTAIGLMAIAATAIFAMMRQSDVPEKRTLPSDEDSKELASKISSEETDQDDDDGSQIVVLVEQLSRVTKQLDGSSRTLNAFVSDRKKSINHQTNCLDDAKRHLRDAGSATRSIAESSQSVFQSAEKTQANNRLVAERLVGLNQQAERADSILENIDTIAGRSDLVALNASLEGMRAGAAGKNFSLAAEEMRRLTETIRNEIGSVRSLIEQLRASTTASVMAIEEGSNLSELNTESALKITSTTSEQQALFDDVAVRFETLSSFLEHDETGSEHASSSVSDLNELIAQLEDLLRSFSDGSPIETEIDSKLSRASYMPEFDSDEVARHRSDITSSATVDIQETGEFTAPMRSTMTLKAADFRRDDGPATVEIQFDDEE